MRLSRHSLRLIGVVSCIVAGLAAVPSAFAQQARASGSPDAHLVRTIRAYPQTAVPRIDRGNAGPNEQAGQAPPVADNRPMTAYGAKAALARLRMAARELGRPEPKGVWRITPLIATVRTSKDGSQTRTIGGWTVRYQDAKGKSALAQLNCWGEVKFASDNPEALIVALPAVPIAEIVLDHEDAHALVLRRGGEGIADGAVGWLMNIEVDRRGVRPVWGGESWTLGGPGAWVVVDAYTGEFYRPSEGNRMQPLDPDQPKLWKEWNGGFDEDSDDAKAGRADKPYWWPRAYSCEGDQFVYNRGELRRAIDAEEGRADRNARSWMTSGFLRAGLGDWVAAETDMSKAIAMEPASDNARIARGLVRLVMRDLGRARADFAAITDANTRNGGLDYVALGRTGKPLAVDSVMRAFDTNAGMLPLCVRFGGVPLAPVPGAPRVR